MKPMANDSSATARETPHATKTSRTNTIVNALKRRAQTVLNDKSIDPQSRAIIRYALEINDPCWLNLCAVPMRAKRLSIRSTSRKRPKRTTNDSNEERIEVLTELICRAGDEPETKAAALLVLMATIENSAHPKALANR